MQNHAAQVEPTRPVSIPTFSRLAGRVRAGLRHRRRSAITREGLYYLSVWGFVVLGAVLRDTIVLVILAGIMTGPLLINWRFVVLGLRQIRVRRQLPIRTAAGESVRVDIQVANRRLRMPSWALTVEDRVEREGGTSDETVRASLGIPLVEAGGAVVASYRLQMTRRGRYRIGPLRVSSRFPLGLVEASRLVEDRQTLVVCPAIGQLARQWSRLIEVNRFGSQRAQRRRGLLEGDYYGLREWRPGDSPRWIHWRTTAKRAELTVMQFEQQRSRDVVLVLDLWLPRKFTPADQAYAELAISVAATMVRDVCRRGGSHLSLTVAGRELEHWSVSHSTPVFANEILDALAVVEPEEEPQCLGQGIERARHEAPRDARVVVVSTRPSQLEQLSDKGLGAGNGRLERHSMLWIDVQSDQLAQYYRNDEFDVRASA